MKTIFRLGLAAVAALYVLHAGAQESSESVNDPSTDSEMYLGEIRSACEAEATGLPDADADVYINECIENMKQSFTGSQDRGGS